MRASVFVFEVVFFFFFVVVVIVIITAVYVRLPLSLISRSFFSHRLRRFTSFFMAFITCLFHRHSIIIHVSGDNQALDEEIEYEPLYETNLSREDQNRKAVRDYLLKRAPATVYIHLFCVLIFAVNSCIYTYI